LWACVSGPVAGSTFILAIHLAVHSPEAFEPFYLHVSGMMLMMKLRYFMVRDGKETPICLIVGLGHKLLYLRWALFYGIFLSIQPFISGVKDMETLFDYNVNPVNKTAGELPVRPYGTFADADNGIPYWLWLVEVWCYVAAHAIMATVGMLAAALSFQYKHVHLTYITLVCTGVCVRGFNFYIFDINESGLFAMALGLVIIGGVFLTVFLVYFWSHKREDETWDARLERTAKVTISEPNNEDEMESFHGENPARAASAPAAPSPGVLQHREISNRTNQPV